MMSSYSVRCPHVNCDWHGSLVPSSVRGGNDAEIASMERAWFQCPRCRQHWEVSITDDTVSVLPVTFPAHANAISAGYPVPKVEVTGDVRIVTFSGEDGVDIEQGLAREIKGAAESAGKHLLLDFTHVKSISSLDLGALVGLHKRVGLAGGRLTLFNLRPEIYDVFVITRLHTLLGIGTKP